MKNLKNAKKTYENIEIPEKLKECTKNIIKKNKPQKNFKYIYTSVASLILAFIIGINISETFATNLSKVPIIGEIVSIISIHGKKIDDDKTIITNTPVISSKNEYVENVTNKVNKEIQDIVNEYTKNAEQHIKEYKEAFIATGGTEEEFNAKNIKVDVKYDVKSESKNHLSLVLNANESWANAYNMTYFYNIDLNTGNNITLKDILGNNYIEIANKSIKNQIEERMKLDENAMFFGYGDNEIEGFATITDETKFYINENNNPVIVFNKYEIAPGAMGRIEFEIDAN